MSMMCKMWPAGFTVGLFWLEAQAQAWQVVTKVRRLPRIHHRLSKRGVQMWMKGTGKPL